MKQPAQSDLPFAVQIALEGSPEPAHTHPTLRQGDLCPQCKAGRLEYDGMLNLSCPSCGYALGGCFT